MLNVEPRKTKLTTGQNLSSDTSIKKGCANETNLSTKAERKCNIIV